MIGFFSRIYRLRPTRPRHPLLRIGFALLGVALLLVLVAGGIVVGLGMLAFRASQRLLRARHAAPATAVLDAEYRVISPRAVSQNR